MSELKLRPPKNPWKARRSSTKKKGRPDLTIETPGRFGFRGYSPLNVGAEPPTPQELVNGLLHGFSTCHLCPSHRRKSPRFPLELPPAMVV